MIAGAVAGMFLFGIYGGVLIIALIIGWKENRCSERLYTFFVIIPFVLGFGFFWHQKNAILNRRLVISTCTNVGTGYLIVDSTLRCKNGEDPRYTIIKAYPTSNTNEQSLCIICNKEMIFHFDSSCVKKDKDVEREIMIEYLNGPL